MRAFLALLLAVGLCSCSHESSPSPAPAAAAAEDTTRVSSSSTTQPEAAGKVPGSSSGAVDLATAASTQQEGADTATAAATDSTEANLERVATLPAAGQLPRGPWVAGKNYEVLSPAQPTDAPAGKVEVIEMFWYACPHCYALDATIEAWRKSKPAFVDFRRVPVTWGEEHRAHARLLYTLQALGKLDTLHAKVFDEIQQQGDLLWVQGDDKGTFQKQLAFAKANGIPESDFTNAYNGMGVQLKVQQADDLVRRERIDSVPTFVINGKYVTDVGMAGDPSRLTRLIDDLAASETHH